METQPGDVRLTTRQLRDRYGGVSDMWVHRRLNDAEDPLPQPIFIAGRRFWRLTDIEAWEARRAAAPRPASHLPRKRKAAQTDGLQVEA